MLRIFLSRNYRRNYVKCRTTSDFGFSDFLPSLRLFRSFPIGTSNIKLCSHQPRSLGRACTRSTTLDHLVHCGGRARNSCKPNKVTSLTAVLACVGLYLLETKKDGRGGRGPTRGDSLRERCAKLVYWNWSSWQFQPYAGYYFNLQKTSRGRSKKELEVVPACSCSRRHFNDWCRQARSFSSISSPRGPRPSCRSKRTSWNGRTPNGSRFVCCEEKSSKPGEDLYDKRTDYSSPPSSTPPETSTAKKQFLRRTRSGPSDSVFVSRKSTTLFAHEPENVQLPTRTVSKVASLSITEISDGDDEEGEDADDDQHPVGYKRRETIVSSSSTEGVVDTEQERRGRKHEDAGANINDRKINTTTLLHYEYQGDCASCRWLRLGSGSDDRNEAKINRKNTTTLLHYEYQGDQRFLSVVVWWVVIGGWLLASLVPFYLFFELSGAVLQLLLRELVETLFGYNEGMESAAGGTTRSGSSWVNSVKDLLRWLITHTVLRKGATSSTSSAGSSSSLLTTRQTDMLDIPPTRPTEVLELDPEGGSYSPELTAVLVSFAKNLLYHGAGPVLLQIYHHLPTASQSVWKKNIIYPMREFMWRKLLNWFPKVEITMPKSLLIGRTTTSDNQDHFEEDDYEEEDHQERDKLNPKNKSNRLYLIHPHGCLCVGFLVFKAHLELQKVEQGSSSSLSLLVAPFLTKFGGPVISLLPRFAGLDVQPASSKFFRERERIKKVDGASDLLKPIAILPGGFEEIGLNSSEIYFKKRKRIIKLALESGLEIVPVYCDGEVWDKSLPDPDVEISSSNPVSPYKGCYYQLSPFKTYFPTLNSFLARKQIPTAGFFSSFFPAPNPVERLKIAIGEPIRLPDPATLAKDGNGRVKREVVDYWHSLYVERLQELVRKNKLCASNGHQLTIL
ncbi:unnamed protein product [Amoebophrya sp. A120]|nr:unnamed protein product [Amoebophrya sp. A120]|eukprot:GSA120T00015671001.1